MILTTPIFLERQMKNILLISLTLSLFCFDSRVVADESVSARRPLRVALYPYVPSKDGLYWRVEREFEAKFPQVDLQYVDTAANYYGGDIADVLREKKADVVEIDTVLLEDLADEQLLTEISADCFDKEAFFPQSIEASQVDGKVFGVPHWVCGNFLFFRNSDPEADRFRKVDSLDDLERILGQPLSSKDALMIDLRGSSTLGEKYLDSMLDKVGSVEQVLAKLGQQGAEAEPELDQDVLRSLDRLFSLCPGGLCDSDKHHDFGEFYARQFAEQECRCLIGYSEGMYSVVDHYLHGVRDGEACVGQIAWPESEGYKATGSFDVDVVPAALANEGQKTLSWVDVLAIRSNLETQTQKDAEHFIEFINSESFLVSVLVPEYGMAPRYLLPARTSVYDNEDVLRAGPLYKRFEEIMSMSVSVSDDDLNTRLRKIGKQLEKRGFEPVRAN